VPNLGWLDPATVSQRIVGHATGGTGGSTACTSGLCGHALTSVSVGGTTLSPGTTVNNITSGQPFTLQVQNGGSQNEFGVGASIKVEGAGTPITATKTINETMAGQTISVVIPLAQSPPKNTPVRVVASVASVPGEKNTANNSLTYLAVFH
jgi:hypothetical protein